MLLKELRQLLTQVVICLLLCALTTRSPIFIHQKASSLDGKAFTSEPHRSSSIPAVTNVHTVPDHFLIRCNFLPAIRCSFVPGRKEEQFCTCTAPKLYRYSVNAREEERFCIGSKVFRYKNLFQRPVFLSLLSDVLA